MVLAQSGEEFYMKSKLFLKCLGGPCVLWAIATAQQQPPPGNAANPPASSTDMQSQVLSQIHEIDLMEIKVGNLARVKGARAAVRRYGDRLVRDHLMADTLIMNFAKRHNVSVAPPVLSSEEQEMMRTLNSVSGSQFDDNFLEFMAAGHKSAVTALSAAHDKLQGTPLRTLVGRLTPILVQHYDIASQLGIREVAKGGV
jgi:putative membrane protein